jgi:hypothetical protein
MDNDLRNGLWNVCFECQFYRFLDKYFRSGEDFFSRRLWKEFFKLPIDEVPLGLNLFKVVRKFYFETHWAEVYDLLELLAGAPSTLTKFQQGINQVLERELSGYRLMQGLIIPISNQEQITAIEEASQLDGFFAPVNAHMSAAAARFADRKSPDYRNSIKESISAVEAMCKIVTRDEKATLNTALRALETAGIDLHPALKQAFDKLYAYTGDAEGIRHALLDEPTLDFEDAKFMLVSCSAFVNYLAAKASKAGPGI